jgi:hypothetical protein
MPEMFDYITSNMNMDRPILQEYSKSLRWVFESQKADQQARVFNVVAANCWYKFFKSLSTQANVKPLFTTADIKLSEKQLMAEANMSFVGGTIDRLYKRTKEL